MRHSEMAEVIPRGPSRRQFTGFSWQTISVSASGTSIDGVEAPALCSARWSLPSRAGSSGHRGESFVRLLTAVKYVLSLMMYFPFVK